MDSSFNESLKSADSKIFKAIQAEIKRQSNGLELIASENFVSRAVLEAQGSVLTNKYAEGYPGKRYYGGCEHVDTAEELAIERCRQLFGAEHAIVQPHSGSQANMAVYFSVCQPGDTILAMNLAHGGHLTHGHKVNFSGKLYNIVAYGVSKKDYRIDMNEVEALAKEHKPKMILAGTSAYSRHLDYAAFREIADQTDALLMADMAHPAGLVAAKLHPDPVPHCDFVTSTTHKTLRGPRGGLILTNEDHVKTLKSSLFPGIQGGPLMHVIAAKAVAFGEALEPDFKNYAAQIIKNAQTLSETLLGEGLDILTGGTDNHVILIDLRNIDVTGKEAEAWLDSVHITVNKNMVPFDDKSPMVTSGLRLGTAALTTRGMKETDMQHIGKMIAKVIKNKGDENTAKQVAADVLQLCENFPIYSDQLV